MSAVAVRDRSSGDDASPYVEVACGALRAVFAPSMGGRLLSLRKHGDEMLWQNPRLFRPDLTLVAPTAEWPVPDGSFSSWANPGGGKTWPAPQGWSGPSEWAGPPDPVLDGGRYEASVDVSPDGGRARVRLTSAVDPRTGLRVSRSFLFADGGGFTESIALENASASTVRWSPWEVVQVASESERGVRGTGVVVEVESGKGPRDLGRHAGDVRHELVGTRCAIPVQEGVAKFGFPSATGSIAYLFANGRALRLRFRPSEGAEYPDAGSRAEAWVQSPTDAPIGDFDGLWPSDWFCELEVLGPIADIAPGGSSRLEIDWEVT